SRLGGSSESPIPWVRIWPSDNWRSGLSTFRHYSPGTEMTQTGMIVVLTTVASAEQANTLVRELLQRRIIACGTILRGARSLYSWEGKITDELEIVILLKTRASLEPALEKAFAELHPYKVPELLALPVKAGLEKYLDWIENETTDDGRSSKWSEPTT
ncbi:MAG: divalent-cation tolerance protein CutA, partial [Acidobacteria bacterium]|nr:divalent-cation tolerance protein CutA [Acidobacteriota bacterium]